MNVWRLWFWTLMVMVALPILLLLAGKGVTGSVTPADVCADRGGVMSVTNLGEPDGEFVMCADGSARQLR